MENAKKYYQLVTDGENSADLYIFGDITSWGKCGKDDPSRSAYNIVSELKAVNAQNINVHINSYGGDVSEGLAIYNVLKQHEANVTTFCDGFACSAASVVFMAGDRRVMSPASLLMIHNAWTVAMGNSDELRKAANDLEVITQASIEAYKLVADINEDEIKELMDNETWILPEDAVSMGFATDIADEKETSGAKQSAFKAIMKKLTAVDTESHEVKEQIEKVDVSETIENIEVPEQSTTIEPDEYGWNKFFKGE